MLPAAQESGLRVFGKASGKAPARVKDISAERDAKDARHITLRWTPVDAATGYIVRWGTSPKNLSNACMVYGDTRMNARFFNRDDDYFFTVDAFNESGIRRGGNAVVAETVASDKKRLNGAGIKKGILYTETQRPQRREVFISKG